MPSSTPGPSPGQSRRTFIKRTAAATASLTSVAALRGPWADRAGRALPDVTLVTAPDDPVARQSPAQWALNYLRESLRSRGLTVEIRSGLAEVADRSFWILASSGRDPVASGVLEQARLERPSVAEALALASGRANRREGLLACGADARGLVYALLELADRVNCAHDPVATLKSVRPIAQRPANAVRSVARLFTSELEDKPWFYDRSFWPRYLTELATHRFNRFSLTLGLGYDFPNDIRDAYFLFTYPFLVEPAGYQVRARGLADGERERNLEMVQFIGQETVRRGLHFQLGIWTHAYQWIDSPRANYVIEGLTAETHAEYCRDALAALLRTCPEIGGVTFRVHGESGVPEGSYDFWKTVFAGVTQCGRRVEIDMHAKGMDDRMIEVALATGMPVSISPKFWAEHMGLGYLQGAIRPLEMPPADPNDAGFFAKSSGSRRFLRYGYGDLLREDRRYAVLHRIWPGTQRLLLWGDPQLAADYGRAANLCEGSGVEWCEPLSFKGRKGSGLAGGRNAYADSSLIPAGGDFEKYLYSYRVWGRRIYDPECPAEAWERWLEKAFGRRAVEPSQVALAHASRILPLVTTTHCPSAANNNYWPEMYTNMAIVDAKRPHPYGDTLSPKRFGTVSSLDPEFFLRIDDYAELLAQGATTPKYTPAAVAANLELDSSRATEAFARASSTVRDPRSAEFGRWVADVTIASGLGLFFAWKIRAAVLFALHEKTGYRPALREAVQAYRQARAAWAKMAQRASGVYRDDVTFGPAKFQRGHWQDRLPDIEADLADMEALLQKIEASNAEARASETKRFAAAVREILGRSSSPRAIHTPVVHRSPTAFRRGEAVLVQLAVPAAAGKAPFDSVRLRYRRMNQAEVWRAAEMQPDPTGYIGSVPGDYTDWPFPLQYHFELRAAGGRAWLYPGFKAGFAGQPYFVVRQAGASEHPSPTPGRSPASR